MTFVYILSAVAGLLTSFYFLFPRPEIVRSTHKGICWRRGIPIVLETGLHWYWPVWSQVEQYPVVRTTLDLPPQRLTSLDGHAVIVSASCVYKIADILKAFTEVDDFETDTKNAARGAVKSVIMTTELEDLMKGQEEVDKKLTRRIRSVLRPFGVSVEEAFLSDMTRARVLALVIDQQLPQQTEV